MIDNETKQKMGKSFFEAHMSNKTFKELLEELIGFMYFYESETTLDPAKKGERLESIHIIKRKILKLYNKKGV